MQQPSPSHPPLIRALLRPAAYSHPADDLRLHETHISWVVLAGQYAYKIKKPVSFGFLDFSTVERRAATCGDEVRLNRRLSPDVYLGVVWVTEADGTYAVGGMGRRVEPAVRMRRLPADGMLTHLLARGWVDPSLVGRIARRLARFHSRAQTGPGVDEYGSAQAVRANWQENFDQTAPFVGRTIDGGVRDEIVSYVEPFIENEASLLARRVVTGRIRDGHGDLHAGSICVEGRKLRLFDCLEFAPRFRSADVAAEVAFLAMDLTYSGRRDLAVAFADAYVRASGDRELLRLLDFYACYRAYVRGKVRSFRLDQVGLSSGDARQHAEDARAYFDLARAYAGGLGPPKVVAVMGLPASGKTTVAKALAGRLGLVHLSSDVVRKRLAGLPPTCPHPEPFGRGLYAPSVTRRTYAALRRRAARWLGRGSSVILDATFGHRAEREALRRLAARAGARLVFLLCEADDATLRRRLALRDRHPTSSSDARLELWPALRAAFTAPGESAGVVRVDTAGPLAGSIEQAMGVVTDRTHEPDRATAGGAG